MCHSGGDVDSRGGCACVETPVIWELSILSTQFFCVNLKLPKTIKFLKKERVNSA